MDQHGAALLAMGIAAAYAKKLVTGQGSRVEGSLFNAGIDLQAEALTLYYSGHHSRERFSREPHLVTWFHEAPYGVYAIADATVALSLNPLLRVAEALENPGLAALANLDAYAERDQIAIAVAEALAGWRWDDLSARFDEHGVWCERVQDYDDLRRDPQAVHNQRFAEIPVGAGHATVVRHPLKFDGTVPPIRTLPPGPGDQTAEILEQLGFSASEVDRLFAENVVSNTETRA